MSITKWQTDSEDTTLSSLTVDRLNGAMMHLDHHLTEVQANASSLDVKGARRTTLIETVEDLPHISLDTHTIVYDLKHGHAVTILVDTYLNSPTVISILESIRQQVIDHLVKSRPVKPNLQCIKCWCIAEIHISLPGAIFIRFQDITHILHHICRLTLQLHLLLIDLPNVKYLVHEVLYTLGVVFYRLQFCFDIAVKVTPHQFV